MRDGTHGGRVAAIITARGGSKGLPRKNLRLLAGKPLLAYSIMAARDCRLIQRCLVSTEDEEIKAVSERWGAEVIDRPRELATDEALSRDVVAHALRWLETAGELPEYFALLQPTSPLRTAAHLTACLEVFLRSQAACAISVAEAEHHPYKAYRREGDTLVPLFGVEYLEQPRQALPPIYRQNGAIYVMHSRSFLQRPSFFAMPALPFVMSQHDSIDVDTETDLSLAEHLLANAKTQPDGEDTE